MDIKMDDGYKSNIYTIENEINLNLEHTNQNTKNYIKFAANTEKKDFREI